MTFESAIQVLEASRRSTEAVVRRERDLWKDAQYEHMFSKHYSEMTAESLRFLEVLRQCDRETATMLRSLESGRG